MIYSLHQFALGGEPLNPADQELIQAGRLFEQFLAQTTDRLIIIIVALFVIFMILGALVTLFLVRGQNSRGKTTDRILEMQAQGALERTQQIKDIQAQNAKTDERFAKAIDTLSGVISGQQKLFNENATIQKALIARTDASITLMQQVTSTVERFTREGSDPVRALNLKFDTLSSDIHGLTNAINDLIAKSDPQLLLQMDERVGRLSADFREVSQRLGEICQNAKRKTDEHNVTVRIEPPAVTPEVVPGG